MDFIYTNATKMLQKVFAEILIENVHLLTSERWHVCSIAHANTVPSFEPRRGGMFVA
jgi:hypothetical protein